MGDNWRRIERALSQRMSYVKIYETDKNRYYTVKGNSGHIYHVNIGEQTSCSCPDFVNNRNRCKHQILCFIHDFNIGINNSILHDDRLSIILSELEEFNFQCIEGDECPICFDIISKNDLLWNCKQCRKVFHKLCIERWLSLSMISCTRSTCPMCRSVIYESK